MKPCWSALCVGLGAAVLLLAPAGAWATYPGLRGQIGVQTVTRFAGESANPGTVDEIASRQLTVATCVGRGLRRAPCDFGVPSYAPNGRTVVSTRYAMTGPRRDRLGRLMLVGADGGTVRVLPPLTAGDRQPAFLADGHTLVFTGRSRAGATPNLYTVSDHGTGVRQITHGGGSQAAPCSDGRVVFDHAGGLYVLVRGLRRSRRLIAHATEPSCAPNDRRVAYVHADALYTIAISGGTPHRVVGARPGDFRAGPVTTPTWSPDGGAIAYLQSTEDPVINGGHDELRIVTPTGGRAAPDVTVDTSETDDDGAEIDASSAGAAWQAVPRRIDYPLRANLSLGTHGTPDSLALDRPGDVAAVATKPGTLTVIFLRQPGAVAIAHRVVIPGTGSGALTLSADGRLVVVADRAHRRLNVLNLDHASGTARQAPGSPTPTPVAVTGVALAPNGRLLAASLADGTLETFKVADTGALTQLAQTRPATASIPLAFNANGISLATGSPAGAAPELFTVDPETGAVSSPAPGPVSSPGPSPVRLQFTPRGLLDDGQTTTDPHQLGPLLGNADNVYTSQNGTGNFAPVPGEPFAPLDLLTVVDGAFSPDGTVSAVLAGQHGTLDELMLSPLNPSLPVSASLSEVGGNSVPPPLAFSGNSRTLALATTGRLQIRRRLERTTPRK